MTENIDGSPLRKKYRDFVQSETFGSLAWKFNQVSTKIESKYRLHSRSKQFFCPICSFEGGFVTDRSPTGNRPYMMCPNCQSAERHRMQFLTMSELKKTIDLSNLSVLHIAPEPAMGKVLKSWFGTYVTADLNPDGVDMKIDLTAADLPDNSYDALYASHVLEHIPADALALQEIARIVKPGGFAVLPVPLVGERTVEYDTPVPSEFGHIRAPGYDYYDRYDKHFSRTDRYSSGDFDERYQLFVYEDRSRYPTPACPYRLPSQGARHRDVVPVAFV